MEIPAYMRTVMSNTLVAVAALSLALTARSAGKTNNDALGVNDTSAIRAVIERYRTSWLANDAQGVRDTFRQDAVLMPHHGLAPVVGMVAIKEFWWPASTAKTTIVSFRMIVDEIGGAGGLAYVRGRSKVAWRVGEPLASQSWHIGGNFLAILKKQADGKWLISHLIWDDPPNEPGLLPSAGEKWLEPSVPCEINGGSGPFVPLQDTSASRPK